MEAITKVFTLITVLLISFPVSAQLPVSLELPRVSPKETRSITIGYTRISFEYSSVGIKGRDIWGGLIPYGEVWRTGANENTLFSVSDDILINGEALPAGEYALHTIPGEENWTLIFSGFTEAWGSYFYDESEDILRVEVVPEKMNSTYEWMKFSFENYTDTSVDMSLKWAGLKIPFTVNIPREVTFQHIENQFRTLPAFSWQGWFQGAEYTLNKGYRMQKGLEWAEKAVERETNPQTLAILGQLQAKTGTAALAESTAERLLSEFSDSWRAYSGASQIYMTTENFEAALSAFKKTKELAPEWAKPGIEEAIRELEN